MIIFKNFLLKEIAAYLKVSVCGGVGGASGYPTSWVEGK